MLRRAIVHFEIYNHTQGIAAIDLGEITVNCNRSDCKRSDAGRTVFIGKGRATVYLEAGTPIGLKQSELKRYFRKGSLTKMTMNFSGHLELADHSRRNI